MKNSECIGLNRQTSMLDKFYTKKHIVGLCLEKIIQNLSIKDTDLFIEPSAGNGAFSKEMVRNFKNVISYDILPEDDTIIKQNYLILETANFENNNYTGIHIIGNPPFGRQSGLAKKFIKKSCLFANSISFILPKSFKKDSFKKTFNEYYHLIYQEDLPNDSFSINDVDHSVPCIFQIWERKNIKRIINEIDMPEYINFVKKNEFPDISFRRVGINAGDISNDIISKNEQSHYFLKFMDKDFLKYFIENKDNMKFESNNTVGPRSISKIELIREIEKIKNNMNNV